MRLHVAWREPENQRCSGICLKVAVRTRAESHLHPNPHHQLWDANEGVRRFPVSIFDRQCQKPFSSLRRQLQLRVHSHRSSRPPPPPPSAFSDSQPPHQATIQVQDQFILLHASLLVASIPRDQPVAFRSKVGFFGIVSCANVWWDWFGSRWNTFITASNEAAVATDLGGESQESGSIQ